MADKTPLRDAFEEGFSYGAGEVRGTELRVDEAWLDSRTKTLERPLMTPRGKTTVDIPFCRCNDGGCGPRGGCCGRCGGAIPTQFEIPPPPCHCGHVRFAHIFWETGNIFTACKECGCEAYEPKRAEGGE